MFTIKLYSAGGFRQRIIEARSFTILRPPAGPDDDGSAEITLHDTPDGDVRYDIKDEGPPTSGYAGPQRFAKAIIENSAGRTTEMIALKPTPGVAPGYPARAA